MPVTQHGRTNLRIEQLERRVQQLADQVEQLRRQGGPPIASATSAEHAGGKQPPKKPPEGSPRSA